MVGLGGALKLIVEFAIYPVPVLKITNYNPFCSRQAERVNIVTSDFRILDPKAWAGTC